jgi:EH signature protein
MREPLPVPADLLESLRSLKAGLQILRHDSERPWSTPPLAALRAAVAALGQDRPARPLVCPDEYRKAWHEFAAGVRVDLGQRAIRYLAWEPSVVLDPRFHYYLDEHEMEIGARGLQGLVRACHVRWNDFVRDATLKRIAMRRLRAYRGTNRILTRWQGSANQILGVDAPDDLAAWMIEELRTPQVTTGEWSIDAGSLFFLETMRAALRKARDRFKNNSQIVSFACADLLGWVGWPLEVLKAEVSESVLHPDARDSQVNGPLKSFVLRHQNLGDPRLPAKRTNWLGVRPEAKQRIIEWLSRDDIVFFFDHAFPRGGDPHRRKPFWLSYVSSVAMSRPLLSWNDQTRLRAHMRQLGGEVGNFGSINGTNSAFLLDFGPICAIEFNHVGACYLYNRRVIDQVVPDFWAPGYFTESGLKRKDLRLARIVHKPGWEEELQMILARHGIRPR